MVSAANKNNNNNILNTPPSVYDEDDAKRFICDQIGNQVPMELISIVLVEIWKIEENIQEGDVVEIPEMLTHLHGNHLISGQIYSIDNELVYSIDKANLDYMISIGIAGN